MFLVLLFSFFFFSCQTAQQPEIQIKGELRRWHKFTLVIEGPRTSEWAKENPFLDYRLEVVFSKGSQSYKVPGYFAADGHAAESSADSGSVWKVHFRPDETGTWHYRISFKKGKDLAVNENELQGEPVLPVDGMEGSLEIKESDKSGDDFRARGRIVNGGDGYFRFQDTDKIWIKNGADSPENFLACSDFDQTLRYQAKARKGEADPENGLHTYAAHIRDWKAGDPSWKNGKGKGIIGAVNYLHSMGVNSIYMLTMNIYGDGRDVWPYNDHNERYRFDCSKLDQWEIVFSHMEKLGMMMHLVLQETENECLLDIGYTGVQRKLYLRELIARYGHHLGVTWNIGEENGPASWSPLGQTHKQKIDMINYLKQTNPYPSIVVVHTHSYDKLQDAYLKPMLGFKNLDGPSMQIGDPARVHKRIKKWVFESEKAGKRWLVSLDEIGPAWKGVMPDAWDTKHDTVRAECLWGSLLAGGAGVEWYFGYRYPHNDLNLEDFRSRENWWKQSAIATQFIKQFSVEGMECHDELVQAKLSYCLAKPGEIYIIYFYGGPEHPLLYLENSGTYQVKWFNPRKGGKMQNGSITTVKGPGLRSLGSPPQDTNKDWVAVVRHPASP